MARPLLRSWSVWCILAGCLIVAGCVSTAIPIQTSPLPLRNATNRGQLVIHSNIKLPDHHRLLNDLVSQREDVTQQLALPTSDEPIHVYLFESPEHFNTFMRVNYPDFPVRRAFFVEGDTRLAVYAHWGDRVAEDLRHEVSHGYLHAVVPAIPLWIDEGLAEFFEVPRGSAGLNWPHVEELTREINSGWRPHLARLESLTSVGDMQQLEYAESWAWAHFMLRTTPQRRALLQHFLQQIRTSREPVTPLSVQLRQLESQPERALTDHIRTLAYNRRPVEADVVPVSQSQ